MKSCSWTMSGMCAGILMIVFGVLFLLGTTGIWPEFTFSKYWPVVVIVVGIHSLVCHCGCKNCKK